MKFVIDTRVFGILPDLVIQLPVIRGFDNTKGKEASLAFLRKAEADTNASMSVEAFWKDTQVTAYLDAFKTFGTDPEVRRPAHVALTKRILEGGQLPDINPIVNIYNAISIKYLTPFGGENLDVLQGDFRLFVATGGEAWFPIGSDTSKPALTGELVWGDDVDLSTRALNWRQCDRTKMTEATVNGFFVMDGFDGINTDIMERAANEFIDVAVRLCGGEATIYWMDKQNPSTQDIVQ